MLNTLLEYIFPKHCVGCDTPGYVLCPTCQAKAFSYYGETNELQLPNYLALFKYQGIIKKILDDLKFKRNKQLLAYMQNAILLHSPKFQNIDFIIPVPLNPLRLADRGFNQSAELIQPYASVHKIPVRTDLVFRQYHTQKLFNLKPGARRKELENAFGVWENKRQEIQNKSILIFDDIITTGNTIQNIIRVLEPYNPKKIQILAFSRPELK